MEAFLKKKTWSMLDLDICVFLVKMRNRLTEELREEVSGADGLVLTKSDISRAFSIKSCTIKDQEHRQSVVHQYSYLSVADCNVARSHFVPTKKRRNAQQHLANT